MVQVKKCFEILLTKNNARSADMKKYLAFPKAYKVTTVIKAIPY